jgi:peptidoglycan hydrolase CwlO-like protein
MCETDTSTSVAGFLCLSVARASARFRSCPCGRPDTAGGTRSRRQSLPAAQGGVLQDRHSIRRPTFGALLSTCIVLAVAVLAAAPAGARTAALQQNRATARALAAEISGLDAQISAAVTKYAQATRALEAVRGQITHNRRQQRLAYRELGLARATLAARAVAMYKHGDVTAVDAMFTAEDFSELVTDLTMVRTLARSDRDVLHTVETTRRELADRAKTLEADEKTKQSLAETCKDGLATIRARLDERRAALAGVRADIRRLATAASTHSPKPTPTVEPPQQGGADGSGPWWSLIQAAASGAGVSAKGMYRLMMVESGGSASVVGPGGYYGLFQYAPSTWKGSWNPWRASSITDGAAQIRATALALSQGYGHAWWDPSYTWAFQGD